MRYVKYSRYVTFHLVLKACLNLSRQIWVAIKYHMQHVCILIFRAQQFKNFFYFITFSTDMTITFDYLPILVSDLHKIILTMYKRFLDVWQWVPFCIIIYIFSVCSFNAVNMQYDWKLLQVFRDDFKTQSLVDWLFQLLLNTAVGAGFHFFLKQWQVVQNGSAVELLSLPLPEFQEIFQCFPVDVDIIEYSVDITGILGNALGYDIISKLVNQFELWSVIL